MKRVSSDGSKCCLLLCRDEFRWFRNHYMPFPAMILLLVSTGQLSYLWANAKTCLGVCLAELELQNLFITKGQAYWGSHNKLGRPLLQLSTSLCTFSGFKLFFPFQTWNYRPTTFTSYYHIIKIKLKKLDSFWNIIYFYFFKATDF